MNWYLKVWKNYVNFSGRARRKEFWMFTLFNYLVTIALASIMGSAVSDALISGNMESLSATGLIGYYLYLIYSLAVFLPSLAVAVRRLHDVNKSGWFILINLLPVIGFFWYLIVMCKAGDEGSNQYGTDPKNEDNLIEDFGTEAQAQA